MTLNSDHPLLDGRTANSPIIRAYRGDRPETTPVWFMRQAGRSLPEYRKLREGNEMLEACLTPDLASEITMQPVRRHKVDAAIFFSDIVIPAKLAGVEVEIVPGRGPVFANPVRTAADVAKLHPIDPAAFAPIREAVAQTVAQLGNTPLIGFAGAPFTLASYMVEGGPSKAQIEAGASAAQLFDSWVGSLSEQQYVRRVAPHSKRALSHLRGYDVPKVHFGVGSGEVLKAMHSIGADVMGVDWRIPLDEADRRLGGGVPLQGNIDPALLGAPWHVLEAHVRDVMSRGRVAPSHVVNLGHGVGPDTDPDVLTKIVELVHQEG